MQTTENATMPTSRNHANVSDLKSADNARDAETSSAPTTGNGTQKTVVVRHESKMSERYSVSPIRVSEQQYVTMREETLKSMSLLNSCGDELHAAMKSLVPHQDSGRTMGEYSATQMRQLAKSVCDIIQTKCSVVRQIHSIVRDE